MLRGLLIVMLGAASFVTVYVAMAPEPDVATPDATVNAALLPAPVTPPAEADQRPLILGSDVAAVAPAEPAPRLVRDVTTAEITAGPSVNGPLVRVETPAKPAPLEPPAEARLERIFNPVVAAAGLIMVGERQIRLAGIDAPSAEETCGTGEWPCGRMARASLRRFIRGRAIECEGPAGAAEIPDPAVCSVAGENLSQWLVIQGWAESTGEAYAGLEINAREDGLGVWAGVRPDDQEALMAGAPESAPDSALAINARVSATP